MTYKGKWPGTWASICDVCGFRFPSDKLKDRWDGLKVCHNDWESRHPQDFIRIREEKIAPDWVRPVAPDNFVTVNYIPPKGGYQQNCPAAPTSIPSAALAGCAVAGTPRNPL